MAEIVCAGVTKRYPDGTEAVKGIDLTIADGEFMVLVGPSGCGKSTLLRMIAGLEDVTEGELSIGGEVVNHRPARDRDIAMVFQNYALYPHMTVRRNMGFALRLRKVDREEIDRRVEEAARILDLTEQLDRKPANLSGGQRQRVAMGRAIVRDPAAFLMDEPLSNLDAKLRAQTRTELASLQDRLGTTTVYVTHDQTEAMTLGDRVAVMRAGALQQVDRPAVLYDEPANLFVAGFIGSPGMNVLPAEVDGDRVRLPMVELPLAPELAEAAASAPGRRLLAGLRPEAFEDAALVEDGRERGATFTGRVEVVEALGSDTYAYLAVEGADAASEHLEDSARPDGRLVARLDARSDVRKGQEAELWADGRALHLFYAESGERLG